MTIAEYEVRLNSYGPIAVTLDNFDSQLGRIDDNWWQTIDEFAEFVLSESVQQVITKLSKDSAADIRALAARLMVYGWQKLRDLPDDHVAHYRLALKWTVPYLEALLIDKSGRVRTYAMQVSSAAYYADVEINQQLRQLTMQNIAHSAALVRESVVTHLVDYYPTDDDGYHILEPAAQDVYLTAMHDNNESVRNWAYFETHLAVASLDDRFADAFLNGLKNELVESDAYMEAAIGAARIGVDSERVEKIIIKNINTLNCGPGWIDAVEQCKTEACLDVAIAWYKRTSDEIILAGLEELFMEWNESW